MKVLVQRSDKASVIVDEEVIGSIDSGLVLLVGFCEEDNIEKIKYMVNKIINLRIFPDSNGVMNKSILDFGGSILSVSQFTLYADTTKGNRPSYIKALKGDDAINLYDQFNLELSKYVDVSTGKFGADMCVNITNIGPTTIILEK